jgi:hypothetical protein
MQILGGLALLVIIGIGILAIADATSQPPPPPKGKCLLVKQTILPDYCSNSCQTAFDCTATFRPYDLNF